LFVEADGVRSRAREPEWYSFGNEPRLPAFDQLRANRLAAHRLVNDELLKRSRAFVSQPVVDERPSRNPTAPPSSFRATNALQPLADPLRTNDAGLVRVELVDQACDVVDVTAGHLRNIHVRYLTRCEVPHAFGFACTGQTRPNRRVADVDQVTADGGSHHGQCRFPCRDHARDAHVRGPGPRAWLAISCTRCLPSDDGGSYASQPEDLDVPDATFACPDLTTFCRLDEPGLVVFGQRLEPDRAVLACRVLEPDEWCRRCGCQGSPRDTVLRRLAHEPFGWRPTTLLVTVRHYRCTGCGHVWRQDTSKAAAADVGGHFPRVGRFARIFFRRRNLQVFASNAGAPRVSVVLIDPKLTAKVRRVRFGPGFRPGPGLRARRAGRTSRVNGAS
jgi:hypothetical protein